MKKLQIRKAIQDLVILQIGVNYIFETQSVGEWSDRSATQTALALKQIINKLMAFQAMA